ncbi:hypothetical protein SERLA73DRAFT_152237 [Serpula lacrymans var. lacrymans S7.3]|uniref:CCHC-type domain-containing protein n=2 Tax=Serpula lacrymans var. lacrymans TaxID=341189 RepID=F8PVD9_SERL3|nr:uncharacterized protein SERLADRAFT_437435 [Serpula lacrymans var. lacrymans S7.9]EGO00149.1 hypothetical protein SERLA73DRAFT_152237 [Serpula lacrymans var. lacrymans S7.3]EGO25711.1 hypothetical protein SERLADRAFT_437435 [Serpula lacrymans var. lacrymans S7.9]
MGRPVEHKANYRKTALAKPELYNSNKKKFQNFFESLQLHFGANPEYFRIEVNKINFALSYMTSGAAAALQTEWVERKMPAEEPTDIEEIEQLESWAHFESMLKDHFQGMFKEERSKYEIMYLKQGTLTTQEYFVKFEATRRRAGYNVKGNEQFLITLIRNNINAPLIKQIIYSGNIPKTYTEWKTRIITNDQLWWDQAENERMMKGMANSSSGSGNWGPNGWYQGEGALEKKAEMLEEKKDGTGTTYGGTGQRMEVDKAKYRAEGRCFKCGEKGHRAQDHKEGGSAAAKPKFNLCTMLEGMKKEEQDELLKDF